MKTIRSLGSILLACFLLVSLFPVSIFAETGIGSLPDGGDYLEGGLIVSLSLDSNSEKTAQDLAAEYGCEITKYYGVIANHRTYYMTIINGADTLETQALLSSDPRVYAADLNAVLYFDCVRSSERDNSTDTENDEELPVTKFGPWRRLAGNSRYYTAKAIAYEGWEDYHCDTVIVATGASFPDALSGSSLAGVYNCPIILTSTNSLSPGASDTLSSLSPNNVIILGSTSAVSENVKNSISSLLPSASITRIYGDSRYTTCQAIYQYGLGNWSQTLILATGATAPDALSVSSFAYAAKAPIFLVQSGTTLQAGMQTAISSGAFTKVVIVGAPEVISNSLENWVKSQIGEENVIRLYGLNRYQTSSKIAEWASGNLTYASVQPDVELSYKHLAIAHGGDDHFADSLSGGALCGYNKSVLLLTKDATDTTNYTLQNNILPHRTEVSQAYILGADSVLSVALEYYLNGLTY